MLVPEVRLLLLAQIFQLACSWSLPTWLRPRDSTSGCMNPNSQPQWTPNSDCPSSLTSPSSCVSSSAYKKHCVAYCEQYLYWFLGHEVTFSDAACGPNTTCTFAGQKSLSITNSYSFSGDFRAKVPVQELEVAFNLGATYTYSKTSTTSQTLTSTRPNETLGDCGYWTFLPYYVTSCGFYITADNADKRIPEDEQCGGLYCETTPFTCSSDYDITFSCTNTTYLDSNGDAEGITIFVATNCDTNERLSDDEQDPRYKTFNTDYDVLDVLEGELINATKLVDDGGGPSYTRQPDPAVLPTCLRGCLCGYSILSAFMTGTSVYSYCECWSTLADIFFYLALTQAATTIYTTPTNLSLLDLYEVDYHNFNASLLDLELPSEIPNWVNISEGSNLTLQKGFECFGNYQTIGVIIHPSP